MSEEKTEAEQRKMLIDSWSPKSVLLVTFIVVSVISGMYVLRDLLNALTFLIFLCVLAIFFAYLLDPLVKFIRRPFKVRQIEKLMPRPLAIVISYLIVFSLLALILSYAFPLVAAEFSEFSNNFENYANNIKSRVNEFNDSYKEAMISEDVRENVSEYVSNSLQNFGGYLTASIGSSAFTTLTYLPWIVLIPVLSFFFLKDAAALRKMFLGCFPSGTWRARADALVSDINTTLAAYTRAQLISCVLIGSVCTLVFTLLGLKYSLLLGLFAGILEFIPLLGPLTIGITAVLVGVFFGNPWQAFWTAVFLIVLRIVHDYYTYPRIVRDGVHLHPFAVILSVLAGEQVAGAPGVFLSIPIIALLTVFYKHIMKHSGRKGLFADYLNRGKDETVVSEDTEPEAQEAV